MRTDDSGPAKFASARRTSVPMRVWSKVVSRQLALEAEIRAHVDAARWNDAATLAIFAYGSELLAFLRAMTSSSVEAEDVFSELCERLWLRLPQFEWRCPCRTWAYTLARNLARDRLEQRATRDRRLLPLCDVRSEALVAAVRSTIERTPAADDPRLAVLRSLLDEDERAMLVLRVELDLPWVEVARILGEHDEAALPRTAARLRKQFERVKQRARRVYADSRG